MKKLMLVFAVFSILGLQVYAQNTITGKVIDDSGEALPGVSVLVKGTTIGTMTLGNGTYSIEVPDGSNTLVFSYIGMKTQEVTITGNVVDVTLVQSSEAIDEVVVTALGISREKKSLGYAVQEVGGDDVNMVKGNDFTSSLSGKVSGVQIQTNTNFGGSTNVIIRGSSSLTGNNQALFVVDGIPIDNTIFNDSYQASGRTGYDYGNAASDINPNDIESISVLKGSAATALYGSRAANGVILITTKKGSKNKDLGVSFSSNYTVGIVDKSTFPTYQKEYGAGYATWWAGVAQPGWGTYGDDIHPGLEHWDWNGDGTDDYIVPTYEDASFGEKFDPSLMVYQWDAFIPGLDTYGKATPWVAAEHDPYYFFNKASTYSNSIQLSGGGDKSTYRFSYQNLSQTGIMPNSKLNKNNFNLTGTYDIMKNLKVTTNVSYINTSATGRNSTGYSGNILSSFRQWWQVNVDILEQKDAFDLLGTNATWNMNGPTDLAPAYWDNYYWQRYKNYETDVRNRVLGYTQLDWKANDFLSFTARASVDNYSYIQEERRAVGSIAGSFGVGYSDQPSGYALRTRNFLELNYDFIANFHKDLTEDINLRGLLGTNIRKTTYSTLFTSTNGGLAVADIYSLANTNSPLELAIESNPHIQVNGYFANASLGFYDMFFLDGSVRMDQSSTLPLDNNTYFYPSVSGSFLFSELISSDVLSFGKIRLNYAEVGNSAPFARLNDVYYQQFPFAGVGVATNGSTKFNPELKPEKTKSLEAGLTLNFLKNRVGFDLSVYDNNSVDQIMPVAVSYATGYSYKYVNAGEINNKGIELMLNFTPVKKKDLKWDMNINWSKNKSNVVSLAEGVDNLQLASLQGGVTINARVGEPYGTIQGTDFLYYNDVKTPENRIITPSGKYAHTETSDQVIGDINPDWIAGIRNSISYKNFNFSFLIDWKKGGDIFSLDMWYGMGTGLYPETAGLNDLGNPLRDPVVDNGDGTYGAESGGRVLPGVMEDGTPNTIRVYEGWYANSQGWKSGVNALQVYDASYIKLREVALTYSLPTSMLRKTFLNDVSLSIVGSNLWILHKNLPYADPETTQGAGNIQGWQSGVMPTTKNIGFTLNVKF